MQEFEGHIAWAILINDPHVFNSFGRHLFAQRKRVFRCRSLIDLRSGSNDVSILGHETGAGCVRGYRDSATAIVTPPPFAGDLRTCLNIDFVRCGSKAARSDRNGDFRFTSTSRRSRRSSDRQLWANTGSGPALFIASAAMMVSQWAL